MKFEKGMQYKTTDKIRGEINTADYPYRKDAILQPGTEIKFLYWTGPYTTIAVFRTVERGRQISFDGPNWASKLEESQDYLKDAGLAF